MEIGNWQSQLRKGAAELVVLSVLRGGEAYGLEILERANGAGDLVADGALYPLLARLERSGRIAARWSLGDVGGNPRKYYCLTPDEIDAFVRRLLWALQSLPHEDRLGIAGEIHSHLIDCAARGGDALARAVDRLGPPDLLARQFVEEFELSGAVNRAAPWRLLMAMLSRASRSVTAFVAGLGAVLLYLFALAFVAIALAKPIIPGRVGAWRGTGEFPAAGILPAAPPHPASEMLGPWIVPLAVLLAVLCYVGGTRLLRDVARRLLAGRAAR